MGPVVQAQGAKPTTSVARPAGLGYAAGVGVSGARPPRAVGCWKAASDGLAEQSLVPVWAASRCRTWDRCGAAGEGPAQLGSVLASAAGCGWIPQRIAARDGGARDPGHRCHRHHRGSWCGCSPRRARPSGPWSVRPRRPPRSSVWAWRPPWATSSSPTPWTPPWPAATTCSCCRRPAPPARAGTQRHRRGPAGRGWACGRAVGAGVQPGCLGGVRPLARRDRPAPGRVGPAPHPCCRVGSCRTFWRRLSTSPTRASLYGMTGETRVSSSTPATSPRWPPRC